MLNVITCIDLFSAFIGVVYSVWVLVIGGVSIIYSLTLTEKYVV